MANMQRVLPAVTWVLLSVGCASQPAAPAEDAAPAAEAKYVPTATVRELMIHIIDPAGDMVWDAASTVIDDKGINDIIPKTDEEWAAVRHGAVALMEAANLLQIPGRSMAQAHEKSIAPGIELEPAAIQALRDKDPATWNNFAVALHDAAVLVRTAVDKKESAQLVELGEALDKACENCHRHYWYPNEVIPQFPSGVTAPTNPSVSQ